MSLDVKLPVIHDTKTLLKHIKKMYIINDYMQSYDKYEQFCTEIRYITIACFVYKECREHPIKFKFYRDDKETKTLQLRHFLYNIYAWYPFCELYGMNVLDESFILSPEQIPHLTDYINKKLIKCMRDYNVKQIIINRNISEVNNKFRSISLDFSDLMNLTFSEHTFIEMYDQKKYRDMMELKLPQNAQPIEIEAILNKVQKKFIETLKADKTNPIGVILRSGTGIKEKQLIEFLVAMALKPTLDGEVMPIAIENSSLIRGLDRASYMYIDATGARKPLIMNNKQMGKAGYFGKILNEMSRTVELSTKDSFCDTKHLVRYTIKTKTHLKKLIGKFYKRSLSDDDYKILSEKDTDLIGESIYCRSATTCNCASNKVCLSCIGKNASLLMDIAQGVGVFLVEEVSKVLEQNILSSKHLLTTNSEKIEFTDEFYNYFSLNSGEINLALKNANSINDLAIFINLDDVDKIEEYDNDSTYNTYINNGSFKIVNIVTGDAIDISLKQDKELYITTEASKMMRENNGYINLKDCDENAQIFEVVILNNELTKPLYDLMHLLDKGDRDVDEQTIDGMSQKMLDILVEAKIGAPMISGELILNRLLRRSDNVMKRPNFSKKSLPDYQFFTITKVLENNESVLIGLGFENLKRQLLNNNLDERTATSFLDSCFSEKVSKDEITKYSDESMDDYYLNIH